MDALWVVFLALTTNQKVGGSVPVCCSVHAKNPWAKY